MYRDFKKLVIFFSPCFQLAEISIVLHWCRFYENLFNIYVTFVSHVVAYESEAGANWLGSSYFIALLYLVIIIIITLLVILQS